MLFFTLQNLQETSIDSPTTNAIQELVFVTLVSTMLLAIIVNTVKKDSLEMLKIKLVKVCKFAF